MSEELQRVDSPTVCTECGSAETEEIETDTTLSGVFIRRFGCNECYAGFEVRYNAVEKETYHAPEVGH